MSSRRSSVTKSFTKFIGSALFSVSIFRPTSAVNSAIAGENFSFVHFFTNSAFFGIFLVLLVGGRIPARLPPLVLTFRNTALTRTLTIRLGGSEPTVPVLTCISSSLSKFELKLSLISSSESLLDSSPERWESSLART